MAYPDVRWKPEGFGYWRAKALRNVGKLYWVIG
jgi:hypothetical protein